MKTSIIALSSFETNRDSIVEKQIRFPSNEEVIGMSAEFVTSIMEVLIRF
jgi:hypothetical protein